MMGKEQDTYHSAFIYIRTCILRFLLKYKPDPKLLPLNVMYKLQIELL